MVIIGQCAENVLLEKVMLPVAVGVHVGLIIISTDSLASASLNPARDLGPRAVAALTGWGSQAWTAADGSAYWWIPPLAQLVGAVLGASAHSVLTAVLHNPTQEKTEVKNRLVEAAREREIAALTRKPAKTSEQEYIQLWENASTQGWTPAQLARLGVYRSENPRGARAWNATPSRTH